MIHTDLTYMDTVPTRHGDVELFRSQYTGTVRTANVPIDWDDPGELRAFGRACVQAANSMVPGQRF
jgi:hypothetical protein